MCGRRPDAFKMWLGWRAKGTAGFAEHVENCLHLSEYFEEQIRLRPIMFKPVLDQGWYANICFWYIPKRLRGRPVDAIWKAQIHKVSFQPHKSLPNFWRAIISNLAVRKEDIDYCISEINRLGEDL